SFRFTSTYLGKTIPIEQLLLLELIRLKVPNLFHVIKIYYGAIKVKETDNYFKVRFHKYIVQNRRDMINNNGVDKGTPDYAFWESVFKKLFRCTTMYPLGYQSTKYSNRRNISYADKEKENQFLRKKDFSNPRLLVSYFERISEIPEEH
ncbi:MAG: hypothetical protein WBG42_14515, partial [Cryomorphaceae bacterium]